MNLVSLPAEFDHHAELDDLEERLSQVDSHLDRGIQTLRDIARITQQENPKNKIPNSISETEGVKGEHYPLCHALVCATMHKIWRHRWRYKYIADDADALERLINWLPHPFSAVRRDSSKLGFVKSLDSARLGHSIP